MLTTEVMITDIPEEKKEPAGGPGGHSHGMEGMYLAGYRLIAVR